MILTHKQIKNQFWRVSEKETYEFPGPYLSDGQSFGRTQGQLLCRGRLHMIATDGKEASR